jgi:hypothetical protein
MPSLPDIPGKSLISAMTKRTRAVAATAGAGALAIGGFVAKRVLGHGDDGDAGTGASADPIAETPSAPPGAEEKPTPKPRPAKPKADVPKPPKAKVEPPKPKAEPAKPKAAEKPKAEPKAKPAKPKGPKDKAKPAPKPKAAKPPKTTGTDAPPKPEVEPGNITGGKDPHHALNNPVVDDPDMTEYPDPYDTREDPRDPADADAVFGEAPHPPTNAESTSEPPLAQDPEVPDGGKPPRRDNLDD